MDGLDQQTPLQMWELVVGFLSPVLLAVVMQPRWPRSAQALVAFAWCVIAAGVGLYLDGRLDAADWAASTLKVLVAAIASYQGVWKPTGVAPAIERATTVSGAGNP